MAAHLSFILASTRHHDNVCLLFNIICDEVHPTKGVRQ